MSTARPSQRRGLFLRLAVLAGLFPIALLVVLLAWAEMTAAPTEPPALTAKTPNPAKAPRVFLSPQERLVHLDPYWAGMFVPAFGVVTLTSWGLASFFLIAFLRSRAGTMAGEQS
jgi:hypothetical protein